MINQEELPIGFTMELARHPEALNYFSGLSKAEQKDVANRARDIQSRSEMRHYVEACFK